MAQNEIKSVIWFMTIRRKVLNDLKRHYRITWPMLEVLAVMQSDPDQRWFFYRIQKRLPTMNVQQLRNTLREMELAGYVGAERYTRSKYRKSWFVLPPGERVFTQLNYQLHEEMTAVEAV